MSTLATVAPPLLARARADQVASLYRSWHRTTASMTLGAAILCAVLWGETTPAVMAAWFAAILANQAWRGVLAHAYRRAGPVAADVADRWGMRWAAGSTVAGALWGIAAVTMYPASPAQQGLLIVCLFGVILGGLNLTAVYKPSFYGFVLPAIVPLIVRVAVDGDQVHLYTALVMGVVLAFVLAFGHHLNGVLTHSLAIRYENLDLVALFKAEMEAAETARAAAEAADRAKSQFLAAASHDLRQPLHAMGLYAAALSARARDTDVKPLVTSIQASIDALEGLFAQLLDLSRLDAGGLSPERGDVALGPLFARLAADFAPQCAAAGVGLRVVDTGLCVESDPLLLERILRNLLANAVRYTRRGAIVLGARRRNASVRIDIVDTGIGIAAADHARIFDEFVQVGATARDAGGRGMGLGLAIVGRLTALLGHPLELASLPGRGSRFSVTAPRAKPRRRRRESPGLADDRSAAPALAANALAGRHIVVIDDDATVVAAMQALFDASGATVTGAADADAAVAALASTSSPVALVVADLRLADGGCGIAAVAALRAVVGACVPALIVSGDASETARAEARAAKLTLLPKPLAAPALLAAAQAALAPSVGDVAVSAAAEDRRRVVAVSP
ncbi:MAG: HAMP domain-containing sensor histidine kinase [Betaproteobacteria bacterium]